MWRKSKTDDQPRLIETEIDLLYRRLAALEKKGSGRRIIAYALKIIAGGSALLIALDIVHDWNRGLGVATLVAVFIDTVFSNHKRLMAVVPAAYAAHTFRDNIARSYNRTLQPIIDVLNANANNPTSQAYVLAIEEKNKLQSATQEQLAKAARAVEDALHKADLQALNALSVEADKASVGKTP